MKKYLFFIFIVLFLNGCSGLQNTNSKVIIPPSSLQNKTVAKEPLWLDDPQKEANGKLTAVGCAAKHINGEVAQKKLAVQRAIDEIAMQKKTKVQTVTYNTKTTTSFNATSKTQSSSLHEVQDVTLSTKIIEYYKKPDGDICVWVVEN